MNAAQRCPAQFYGGDRASAAPGACAGVGVGVLRVHVTTPLGGFLRTRTAPPPCRELRKIRTFSLFAFAKACLWAQTYRAQSMCTFDTEGTCPSSRFIQRGTGDELHTSTLNPRAPEAAAYALAAHNSAGTRRIPPGAEHPQNTQHSGTQPKPFRYREAAAWAVPVPDKCRSNLWILCPLLQEPRYLCSE